MTPPPLTDLMQQQPCVAYPTTFIVIATTVIINLVLFLKGEYADDLLLHDSVVNCPYRLLTYVFTVPYLTIVFVPLYVVVYAVWGSAAEAAVGQLQLLLYGLFTILVSGMLTMVVDKVLLAPIGWLFGTLYLKKHVLQPEAKSDVLGSYMYWGMWPTAHVIILCLCRARGTTTPIGVAWRNQRLTLQQLPLLLVACAAVLDLAEGTFGNFADHTIFRRGYFYHSDPPGWSCVLALISFFVAWFYERHASGTANAGFALDNFFYPAAVRTAVRQAGEATHGFLRPTRLRVLLPPSEPRSTFPLPSFLRRGGGSGVSVVAPSLSDTVGPAAPLPGTSAEEAERFRLIGRAALQRRLQEQHAAAALPKAADAAQQSPVQAEEASDDKTA